MSNYEAKSDLKRATVDTFDLGKKSKLAKLKSELNKIGVDKLKTVSVDLSKLSNIVNNNVVNNFV